mgnify:CR=1 FL=1|tara:strand:- start:142 stop:1617 length:1476 start_codon:yes stop_codon:yes gene_type:complete
MKVNNKFKTKPYRHQEEAYRRSANKTAFAYLMEMGTGKSKSLLDDIARLYTEDQIDFAIIIAPKGVYRNWLELEIPAHFWESIPTSVSSWQSPMTKGRKDEIKEMCAATDKMKVFVMNVEAFSSIRGREAGEWFGRKFGARGLIAVDESTTIKNHKAKRTKALIKLSRSFKYKRILTGSPVTNSPLDLFAQCEFLGTEMLGFSSFYAFQARYAVLKNVKMGTKSFNQIIGFRHIEELTKKLEAFSFRVLKDECLDLPEKIYTARYVSMTKEQLDMYTRIQKQALLLLDNGDLVSTPAVITQMLRLQQILSGHLKTDDGELISFPTQRLDALLDICQESSGKIIIWSRFRYDIISITKTLKKIFGDASTSSFFGDTSEDERQRIIRDFQSESSGLRFFIGNPATAGRGLTLTRASTVVYYTNDFNLETRAQSEDRAHRISQHNPVTYIDLVCEGTIDEKIVKALTGKIKMSANVLGENVRKWLKLNPKSKAV